MSKGTGKVSIGAGRDHPGKKLKVWLAQNALVLSVGLLLSMALYYPIVRDGLENLDSFCTAEPYWADQWEQIPYWETVQGRWGLRLCDALTAGMHPYFLTVLAVSVFYLLGTLLICDLLDIRSRYLRLVSAALVGCSQYVMNIQTYRYCSAAYAFSFFLAVLAAVLASRRRGSLVAAGALCLLFSLGLYQCSLGVTAVLCLFVIFRVLVRRGRFDTEVRTAVTRLVAMGGSRYTGLSDRAAGLFEIIRGLAGQYQRHRPGRNWAHRSPGAAIRSRQRFGRVKPLRQCRLFPGRVLSRFWMMYWW